MCLKMEAREIKQLWYAAKLYYFLLPKDVDKSEIAKTVGQWSKECESANDFHTKPLFVYSCHLASCAIRLYSIDEKINNRRYEDYKDWWKNKQKGQKFFTAKNTGRIIHCVLRNLIAHDEEKSKDNQNKRSYKELQDYYHSLHFHELHQGMLEVIESIELDLRSDGIVVDTFL